jgi:hypothetical protein
MCAMRPFLERLPWQEGSSLAVLDRQLEEAIPFQWHHHPEFELTLTLNSCEQRFMGDHVGEYDDCDLVLVGPNLPHTWVSREAVSAGPHVALVIWFHPDWAARVVRILSSSAGSVRCWRAPGADWRFRRMWRQGCGRSLRGSFGPVRQNGCWC